MEADDGANFSFQMYQGAIMSSETRPRATMMNGVMPEVLKGRSIKPSAELRSVVPHLGKQPSV